MFDTAQHTLRMMTDELKLANLSFTRSRPVVAFDTSNYCRFLFYLLFLLAKFPKIYNANNNKTSNQQNFHKKVS